MRVATSITISLCVAFLLGCSNNADSVQGPAKSIAEIEVGTPKNEIVQRLGKPLNWATLTRTNRQMTATTQMTLTTVFDLNAAKREMPAEEIWLFEYSLADGRKYAIHFLENKVANVVEGPLLKE